MRKKTLRISAAILIAAALCASSPVSAFAGVLGSKKHSTESTQAAGPGSGAAESSASESGTIGNGQVVAAPPSEAGSAAETQAQVQETQAQVQETQAQVQETQTQAQETQNTVAPAAQETAQAAVGLTTEATNGRSRGSAGLPGHVALTDNGGNMIDLNAIRESAGLDALGTGNTPPDAILNQVQIANYRMLDKDGKLIDFTATNDPGKGIFSADGFSKFYMIHDGVARFYYRVYSDQHGWSEWCTSKETTPINDDGAKVQAIQIRSKGYVHTFNDVYYKVILNDGTVLDWAKNGQTTGTMGTDRYIVGLRVGLWHNTESFPFATKNLMAGCSYDGAWYENGGSTHYSSYNGQPYTGWGWIDNTQYYFINGEPASGWQYVDGYKYYFNADGSLVTDLEPIMGLQSSYHIEYNKTTRTMYIMAPDGDNGYIIPYKTFNTTCGPDTPLGTYKTYVKYDVKFMHEDENGVGIYCKYLSRFFNGFLIHSILFYTPKLNLDAITYNYIDDAASGGCIRLLTGDAYWVYKNCPTGTQVHIYEDKWDKGPVEKGAIEQCIPRSQTWDPTDPSSAEAVAALQAAAQAEQERAEAIQNGTIQMTAEEAEMAKQLAAGT